MAIPNICDPMLELQSAFSRESHVGTMRRVERFAVCGLSPFAIGRMNRRQWRQAERWAWVFRLVTDTYTSSGSNTWTCPAGVTSVQAEVWGAGGSPNSPSGVGRGGGGGGAYSLKSGIAVTPSTGYTAYVGTAVAATNGEDSYFVDAATCMAKGGIAATTATGAAGGAAASGVGDTKYSGGNGGNGAAGRGGGGGGSSAGTGANGNNGSGESLGIGGAGATAPTGGGNGGRGGDSNPAGTNAQPGSQPGGGGGGRGRTDTQSSGVGGDGKVAITYTDSGQPAVRRFGGALHAVSRIHGMEGAYIF